MDTMDEAKTPTNESFARSALALAAQKPLPPSFPDAMQTADLAGDRPARPTRVDSEHSRSSRAATDDMKMDHSDGETATADDANGLSDDESVNADGSRPSKKKKSQRFYCTDYPPCNLSFTRSEHLARHIRKHTGERPFQCHCSRRFSRLDNLRQHAQTVHVNEDIPIDSLAATGTRFQRQIRTDRVRATAGGRARSSTAGSIGTPMRGHSKSLSTSSIASVSSVGSSVYPGGGPDEIRRRPPPLVMADPRSRMSMEGQYRTGGPDGGHYRPMSPTDFSTPTSATFSNGQGSPRWGSSMVSPSPSHGRTQSMYSSGSHTPGRRLSVPSSNGNPFQSPPNPNTARTLFGGAPANNPTSGGYYASPNNASGLASPTTSTNSSWSRRESISNPADEAWRRRTWHPDTREFNNGSSAGNGGVVIPVNAAAANAKTGSPSAASRLSHSMIPSQYQTPPSGSVPIADPSAQQTNLRLPGIESFDPLPHRPASPPRRIPSPMAVDSEPAHYHRPTESSPPEDRRLSAQWDHPLQRGLTRLEIASSTPPRDGAGAWATEASRAVLAQADQTGVSRQQQQPPVPVRQTSVRFFDTDPRPAANAPFAGGEPSAPSSSPYSRGHHHTVSAPAFNTPRQLKRQGWYNGPVTVIPDTNNPPSEYQSPSNRNPNPNARVERMVHPNLANGFTGFTARVPQTVPEHQTPQQHQYMHHQQQRDGEESDPLRRLEALVAVATSEASATAAY